MQLRDYQQSIVNNAIRSLDIHQSICIQAPTGAGKTIIIASLCEKLREKFNDCIICITTPRVEVMEQISKTVFGYNKDISSRCIFLTPQKMANWVKKNEGIPFILFIDEAHHTPASTYIQIAQKCRKLIGLTATPIHNGDRKAMATTYEKLIHGPLLSELVDDGFLATPYLLTLPVNESMKYDTVKGNESAARVFKANDVDIVYESIIEAYSHVCSIARKKLTALVFAISRAHGKRLNQEFINAGIDSQYLDSLTTKEERKRIVEDFRDRKLQVMVNIDLFGEGFDAPNCDAVLMARPTSSEILFFQQCGRALRPSEGKKYGYIMDCAGNCRRILDSPGLVNRVYTFETVESYGTVVGKASMKQQAISNVESIGSTEKNEQKGEVYVNEDEWDATIGVISERNANIRKLNRLLISDKKTGLKGYIEILSYCILCSPSQEEFLKILKRVAEINGYAKGWIHYQLKDWRDNEKNYILMHSRQVDKRDEYINSLKKEKVAT